MFLTIGAQSKDAKSKIKFYRQFIAHRGVQSPTLTNTIPPKRPTLTRNDITQVPEKLSVLPKIKFPVHSYRKYILQKESS